MSLDPPDIVGALSPIRVCANKTYTKIQSFFKKVKVLLTVYILPVSHTPIVGIYIVLSYVVKPSTYFPFVAYYSSLLML